MTHLEDEPQYKLQVSKALEVRQRAQPVHPCEARQEYSQWPDRPSRPSYTQPGDPLRFG
jgi:hypothetical protein